MEASASASATSSAASSVDGRGGGEYLNLGMFGGQQQQSGVSDLLLGAGGFGSSLGNGFGNDGNSANSSNAGASSTGGSAFDLSDFPSLGGNTNGVQQAGNSGNGLAAALRQQQQLIQHQQMLQGSNPKSSNLYRLAMSSGANGGAGANFNMATEDFPALPGAPPAGSSGNNGPAPSSTSLLLGGNNNSGSSSVGGVAFVAGANSASRASPSVSSGGLYSGDLDGGGPQLEGGGGVLGGSGLGGLGVLGGLQQNSSANRGSSTLSVQSRSAPSTTNNNAPGSVGSAPNPSLGPSSAAGTALSGDYGLLGLLGVIRMTDADRNSLALGSDLTLLGLSLGSSDQIYQTFSSPWTESVSSKEPHYQLPVCYYMQPPALKTGHLSKFQLETLFYIFYALPKDVLQAYAAQELYTREWRYHADNKLWFKRAGSADGIPNATSGVPQYLYFDINTWERRIFNGSMNQNFTSSFLSEESVRVKFSNP
ncbi:Probable NOT transcription complex subunit VIP2 [Seminavis robusta]|uniref:Probable NOT transcription complex subunit VIP2 n=1 Tax=Seminavis robusta TaxID=568900 RepID=A0A9N8E011_9STRA|nr:Probable NOT transcription complex subunit VIP2 [Seminavis robusta]|eukprot:Sro413_g138150.1 Probable NOT transcription complex subunit VIP2 (480) ;mRNA; r:48572-50113